MIFRSGDRVIGKPKVIYRNGREGSQRNQLKIPQASSIPKTRNIGAVEASRSLFLHEIYQSEPWTFRLPRDSSGADPSSAHLNNAWFCHPGVRGLLLAQSAQGGQQIFWLGVVAEGFAHMGKAIDVAGSKHKTATELEWIFSQAMLAHSDGLGALAGARVIRAEEVKQVGFFEFDRTIGFTLVIDQQGEGDAGLFAKVASVADVAQTDSDQPGAFLPELLLVFAQLRDVLTAEDSTIVTEKDDDSR